MTNKLTQRQKEFLLNLEKTISILTKDELDNSELKFKILPIDESKKKRNSIDDIMRLGLFSKEGFEEKLWNKEEVVEVLTAPSDKFPLWIDIQLDKTNLIELKISSRFRKFEELLNQEYGFPPFRIIK